MTEEVLVRKNIVRVTCDRCGAIEDVPTEFEARRIRILTVSFGDDVKGQSHDLCVRCADEVQTVLKVALARRERSSTE
jgi:ribosomal protein L37E